MKKNNHKENQELVPAWFYCLRVGFIVGLGVLAILSSELTSQQDLARTNMTTTSMN